MQSKRRNLSKTISSFLILFILGSIIGCGTNQTPTISSPLPETTATTVSIASTSTATISKAASTINIDGQQRFLFGANYPWYNYGTDFGENAWGYSGVAAKRSEIESDFEKMSNAGIQAVRWFVFADGRASPEFSIDGSVTGLDSKVFDDLDAALEIAQNHNIHLVLVLLDFHWLAQPKDENGVTLGGHSNVIEDTTKRDSFFQNALFPLLQRYGKNPFILAWEVINEPEWAIDDPDIKTSDPLVRVPLKAMQDFVSTTAQIIHENSTGQFVTVGGASRRWWNFWETTGLDICQFHYYDWMEDNQNSKLDFPYENINSSLPCIVGEFPTKGSKTSLDQYYQSIYKNKYAGAFPWSLKSTDDKSDLLNQLQVVQGWSQQLRGKIEIPTPANWVTPISIPTQTFTPIPTLSSSPTPQITLTATSLDTNADVSMYGFEIRDDEWVAQTYDGNKAVTAVHRVMSPSPVYAGKYALQLDVNLIPKDAQLSKGEAYVEVIPFPPSDNSAGPYNLANSTITCQVYLLDEVYSANHNPWIGIQVFVKDSSYRAEYGSWRRVQLKDLGKWLSFSLKPRPFPPPDGYMTSKFDPSVITTIGVKIGVDDYYAKTGVGYNGPVYIDACSWK